MAEEMTVLPGMDEVGSLLWIADHHDSGDYDVVVVDAAPTGETLRLLSMPEAGRWWMEKVEPIGRRITKLTGPIIQRVVGMPIPSSEVFDAARSSSQAEHMHDLLVDPDRTSVRVVLYPERVVIKEAQRSFTYFHPYGYLTDLVVANRILPDDVGWSTSVAGMRRSSATDRWWSRPSPRSRSATRRTSTARWWGWTSCARWKGPLYAETDPTNQYYYTAGRTRLRAMTASSCSASSCRSPPRTRSRSRATPMRS